MITITDKIKLPPLPPHPNIAHEGGFHLHPDCQFTVLYKWARSYARAAVEADRASRQPAASAEPECWCETCRPITLDDMRMVLCPICGNKRCPHATDHRNACTGSNEPGQPGSSYGPRAASVAQEPVAEIDKFGNLRMLVSDAPCNTKLYAAPVAAQPSVPEYPTRTGRAEGRLAGRPFQSGDVLPAPGSYCLVSGANCDIESDQHRGYSWRQVLGYSNDRQFICLQTNDCWPTVERTANCWFAEIPHPDGVAPTPPAVEPRLCPKCGADRSKVPCPGDLMNCPIRGEAQATVERPISDVLSDVVTQGIGIMRIDPTDIYQSTPPAVEQPSAQGREDTERLYAIKEGVRNAACDNHFASRGHLDYNIQAAVFNAGFDRGWDAAIDAARKEQP